LDAIKLVFLRAYAGGILNLDTLVMQLYPAERPHNAPCVLKLGSK
jgi:hypothetical protein